MLGSLNSTLVSTGAVTLASTPKLEFILAADYTLLSEIRRFEADYAGAAVPSATIEVTVKLLQATDQDVVATQTFLHPERRRRIRTHATNHTRDELPTTGGALR